MLMLRIVSAVAGRLTLAEHNLFNILKLRVSTAPCARLTSTDSSFELADLHDQCVGANLRPLGTFLCRAPHAALIFRAFLLGAPYEGLRSDIYDQMVGESLAKLRFEPYDGIGSVASSFCPALLASMMDFAAPAQRVEFLRRVSLVILGAGDPPGVRSALPDRLKLRLYDPNASTSASTYSRGRDAQGLGYHTPPSVLKHRLELLRRGHPLAHSEHREPATIMTDLYRRATTRAQATYPLDPACETAWRLWYSPVGGVMK